MQKSLKSNVTAAHTALLSILNFLLYNCHDCYDNLHSFLLYVFFSVQKRILRIFFTGLCRLDALHIIMSVIYSVPITK